MGRIRKSAETNPQSRTQLSTEIRENGQHPAPRNRGGEEEPRWITKRRAIGLLWTVLAIFCLCRIITFIPAPLDSPWTLRPLLYNWFATFLAHSGGPEQAFSAWFAICGLMLLIPPLLALLNYGIRYQRRRAPNNVSSLLCSRALFFTSIGVCLFLCRYPTLLEPEINPDEGQFLASADKLFYDGNFFRSVDCGTSGPVNIYPLMLPSIAGLTPDYASGRVIALAMTFISIWLFYLTVRCLASDAIARIATIPVSGIFAVIRNPDFIHYTSENVPILLGSLALYGAVRVLREPTDYRAPIFLMGLVSAAGVLAKLQALPILAVIVVVALGYVYMARAALNPWRPALFFIAGLAPLLLLNAAVCFAGGVWGDFWTSYVTTNLHYADVENSFAGSMPTFLAYLTGVDEVRFFLFMLIGLGAAFAFLTMKLPWPSSSTTFVQIACVSAAAIALTMFLYTWNRIGISPFLAIFIVVVAPIFFLVRWLEVPFEREPVRWFGVVAFLITVAAVFSIYEPHRPYSHYLLFLLIPLGAAMAWMLIRQTAGETTTPERQLPLSASFVALVIALSVVCQIQLWGKQDSQVFQWGARAGTIRDPEGDYIRSLTSSRGQITVWGWTVAPYVSSGRVPATRDTNMANFFRWPDTSAYYRNRFLNDMRDHTPELFIDAVGESSFAFKDPKAYAFEQFPEIANFIYAHYVHYSDKYSQHFYLRRDLAALKTGSSTSP